ncbi:MAG TPA: ATP-binding protein [Terriglobia bacterium]|nr:ATP-binding protein [Terriglobia bacterium]
MALRLHSRLVALNVIALSLITLLLGYFAGSQLKATFESEVEGQLYRSAHLAKDYIRLHPAAADPPEVVTAISRLLNVRVTLIAPDGRVLGDSEVTRAGLNGLENHGSRPEFVEARRGGRGTSIRYSSTLSASFIYVAVALDDGSILRLAMPLSSVDMLLAGLRRHLALAMLIGVGVSLVFGYMVYAVVSRPLHKVAEASRELAYGNLQSGIPVVGDSDLATVGSSLNAMARNLRLKMAELEADKHRTDAVIAAMSAGVVVFDKGARVVLANSAIHSLLGLQIAAEGRIPMELVRHPSIEAAVRMALDGADGPAIELKTGKDHVLLAKAAPVRALSGEVELVVMVFHDLTEIRRMERMRKDFVANASHEFKTPLTSIRGYAETLLNLEPGDPAVHREFLEAIDRNSTLLQALVDDLLVLASLESEVPISKERFNLRKAIEQQVQSKQQLLSLNNLKVEIDCPDVEIEVDHARLMRALSNLIDNAIHYNRPGGTIRMVVTVTGRHVRFDITDTGAGIPPADLARVFERFYRVDKSRTRDSGGTGLGLAIAKHAIESQGGTISVSSRIGAGSTFTIHLPVY